MFIYGSIRCYIASMKYIILLVFSCNLYAEMYVWRDERGVKHVSTHPRHCINQESNILELSCSPIIRKISPAVSNQTKPDESHKLLELTDAEKCREIKSRLDDVNKKVVDAQLISDDITEELVIEQNRYASLYEVCRPVLRPTYSRQISP
jgi:hypothetical protein